MSIDFTVEQFAKIVEQMQRLIVSHGDTVEITKKRVYKTHSKQEKIIMNIR